MSACRRLMSSMVMWRHLDLYVIVIYLPLLFAINYSTYICTGRYIFVCMCMSNVAEPVDVAWCFSTWHGRRHPYYIYMYRFCLAFSIFIAY